MVVARERERERERGGGGGGGGGEERSDEQTVINFVHKQNDTCLIFFRIIGKKISCTHFELQLCKLLSYELEI